MKSMLGERQCSHDFDEANGEGEARAVRAPSECRARWRSGNPVRGDSTVSSSVIGRPPHAVVEDST